MGGFRNGGNNLNYCCWKRVRERLPPFLSDATFSDSSISYEECLKGHCSSALKVKACLQLQSNYQEQNLKMNTSLKNAIMAISTVALSHPGTLYADQTSPEKSQDIVISASRVEISREASGSAISILDDDYLEQNQVRLVSDALRDIPGVAVSRSGGTGSLTQVRIRGAEGNQTLVLIDGIEVNDIGSGSEFDFADLTSQEVERIEVLRGAQSALWGSDAMGGVINIITKKGSGLLNGKTTLEGGSFGTSQGFFNINAGTTKYHYSLNGTVLNSDGISVANEDRGNNENDSYKNSTLSFKGGINPTDILSAELILRHVKADSEEDDFAAGVGAVDADNDSKTKQSFAKISTGLDLMNGDWKHTWGISGNDTQNESYNGGALSFTTEGEKLKYEYQTDFYLRSDELEQRMTLVAEREQEQFFSESAFSTIDREMDTSGFVIEYGANIGDTYYITVAGRRDLNNFFQNANTYRFTLAGWATNNVRFHGSKGTGIKNPTLFELFGSAATYNGNANLRPEKNATWDIGSEYHFDEVEGYADLTFFRTDVDNLITGAGLTSINLSSNSNIKGVEFGLVLKPSNNLRLNANYTFTDSDDGAGNTLVRRARHIANINSSYLFENTKTRITGGIQYNGKQDDFEFDAMWNRTQVTLDDFTLVNVAINHEFSDWVDVFARIENLTDEDYEEVLSNGTKGINAMLGMTIRGEF